MTSHSDFTLFCEVIFFSNKRKIAPELKSSYRPHFLIKGQTEYLGICFVDGQQVLFDTPILTEVSPMYEGVDYSGLVENSEFFIMEGGNKVGEGIVKKLIFKR